MEGDASKLNSRFELCLTKQNRERLSTQRRSIRVFLTCDLSPVLGPRACLSPKQMLTLSDSEEQKQVVGSGCFPHQGSVSVKWGPRLASIEWLGSVNPREEAASCLVAKNHRVDAYGLHSIWKDTHHS